MNTLFLKMDVTVHPHVTETIQQVVIRSDDDGHEYLIPKQLEDKFNRMEELAPDYDDLEDMTEWNDLVDTFNAYRMEGNQPPLYAKVGYEKEL